MLTDDPTHLDTQPANSYELNESDGEQLQSPPNSDGEFDASVHPPPPNEEIPLPTPPENPGNTVPSKTLWMGDVESWWDEDFIINLWMSLNKKVEVKVIKPRNNLLMHQLAKSGGNNQKINHSGYCFIEFESPELATEALKLNSQTVPNTNNCKTFRLNWASAATLDTNLAMTPEYSLFVGDLSSNTTEAHLLSLFQTHFNNSIKTVRVMTDPSTNLSRCFGFVRFNNEVDRQKALLEMNGKWLDGRQIRVALATPKHHNSEDGNKFNNRNNRNRNMDQQMYFNGPIPPIGFYPAPLQPMNSAPPAMPVPEDPNNTTVFVGGLANGINEDTLEALFEAFGTILNIKVPPGKGCGFVKFQNREDAETAISNMQGFVIAGSRIRLSWGKSNNGKFQRNNNGYRFNAGSPNMSNLNMNFNPNNGGMNNINNMGDLNLPQMNNILQHFDQQPPPVSQMNDFEKGNPPHMVSIHAGLPPPFIYDMYHGQSSPSQPHIQMNNPNMGIPPGPPPPSQYAIDQNGQLIYLSPPLSHPQMIQTGGPHGMMMHQNMGNNYNPEEYDSGEEFGDDEQERNGQDRDNHEENREGEED